MPTAVQFRADVDLLHLGIRAGDVVTWDAHGATITRAVTVTAGALAGAVADGTLTPLGASSAAPLALQQAG